MIRNNDGEEKEMIKSNEGRMIVSSQKKLIVLSNLDPIHERI